jgi:predicted nucleic acid-binding protein
VPLIDHLRGRGEVVDQITALVHQGHRLGFCGINVAEVYSGLRPEEQDRADRLLDALDFHDIPREAAKQAGQYRYDFARQGVALSATDSLVAGVARGREPP